MLLGLRLLLGIGESVGFPCVSKLIAAVVPVKSLGAANGIVAFGYILGRRWLAGGRPAHGAVRLAHRVLDLRRPVAAVAPAVVPRPLPNRAVRRATRTGRPR